jgi:wyosine [tRNA(Phe)-imidazoG37] synthetase (radical SAM superfamily)
MLPKNNEIRFETTTKCNYNCIICPRERFIRKKETMPLEQFKRLLEKVLNNTNQYDTVTFSGFGEPLLDPTLDEKIRFVKEKNLHALILSNGSLLTVKRFDELEQLGVKSIRISFYGMTPQSYSQIHGISDLSRFEKIKETITKIAETRQSTEIILTYNIVEGINSEDTQKWIDYWKDRVDLIEVWKPHNWVDGRTCRQVQDEKLKTCGRPWNTPLQIQVDGTVNMCCFDYNGKLLLGDLNTQTLDQIFLSDNFKKILHCHETGNFEGSGLICKDCDQRNAIKSDVMIYNSKFRIEDRVGKVSTTYSDLL